MKIFKPFGIDRRSEQPIKKEEMCKKNNKDLKKKPILQSNSNRKQKRDL